MSLEKNKRNALENALQDTLGKIIGGSIPTRYALSITLNFVSYDEDEFVIVIALIEGGKRLFGSDFELTITRNKGYTFKLNSASMLMDDTNYHYVLTKYQLMGVIAGHIKDGTLEEAIQECMYTVL